MNLSPHFTLQEFIRSEKAARFGLDNTPNEQATENLRLVASLMEQIRSLLGHPIIITSGYRSSAVNKAVGSKPTSYHLQGLACDFVCPNYGTPDEICKTIDASGIDFDKCILEFYNPATGDGWVHIQIGRDNRRQMLTINQHGTFAGVRV